MGKDIHEMNIYEKIQAVMKDVTYLQKDDTVAFGKTRYRALSEEKVTSIMHDMMVKYGLVVYPEAMSVERVADITHVDVYYRMVNVDDPEDSIQIVSAGDGADTQDKGSGKAMTYAFKYMWLRTFAIPTGEDPDKVSSAELDAKNGKKITQRELENLVGLVQASLGVDRSTAVAKVIEITGKKAEFTDRDYAKVVQEVRRD